MTSRGRPRKYNWFSFKDLSCDYSKDAQYLKWASSNNWAIQSVVATGCPMCHTYDFEFRHDKKHKIIRFHCENCRHETSFRIKTPKPGTFKIKPVFKDGIQVNKKIVDSYHPLTERQRSDSIVTRIFQRVENGIISLGGEWCADMATGGSNDQKRYYSSFMEAIQICKQRNMQIEHEQRLSELEREVASYIHS